MTTPTLSDAFDLHHAYMTRNGAAAFSKAQLLIHRDRFLADWKDRPVNSLTRAEVIARFELITDKNGPSVANHTMRSLRAAINRAMKRMDEPFVNPVIAVDFHREHPRENAIPFADLPKVWRTIGKLPSATRQRYHRFLMLTGVRPGTAKLLEPKWIDLPARKIVVPGHAIKTRKTWVMPISEPVADILEEALTLNPERPFPVTAHRERALGCHCGYAFRKTFRTACSAVGLSTETSRMLMAHAIQGIDRHYVCEGQLFDQLREASNRVAARLLELAEAEIGRSEPRAAISAQVEARA